MKISMRTCGTIAAGCLLLGLVSCDRATPVGPSSNPLLDVIIQEQIRQYDEQLRRGEEILLQSMKHQERYERLLSRWEEQADRIDVLISRLEGAIKKDSGARR